MLMDHAIALRQQLARLFREAMRMAGHNAFHPGQNTLMRRLLGDWT